MILRKASIEDIPLLIKLRVDYLNEHFGELVPTEEDAIKNQLENYFAKHIPNDSFIAILAEINGNVVATAYLIISERPANPLFITGITGTLLNVLTYPEYRRKGISTKVINKVIDEAKRIGVSSIDLAATNDGKPLYEKLGFYVSNYTTMKMKLI